MNDRISVKLQEVGAFHDRHRLASKSLGLSVLPACGEDASLDLSAAGLGGNVIAGRCLAGYRPVLPGMCQIVVLKVGLGEFRGGRGREPTITGGDLVRVGALQPAYGLCDVARLERYRRGDFVRQAEQDAVPKLGDPLARTRDQDPRVGGSSHKG